MALPLSGPAPLSVRPITPDDAAALREQVRQVREADNDPRLNPAGVCVLLGAAGPALHANSRAVLGPDGGPVAAAMLVPGQRSDTADVWVLVGAVHPAYRRRGYGRHLVEWALARGAAMAGDLPHGRMLALHADCRQGVAGQQALFASLGFAPVREFAYLQRDLARPIAAAAMPDGIRLDAWRSDLDADVRLAYNETFARHFSAPSSSAEDWKAGVTDNARFRPDLSAVATCGGALAGYALAYVDGDEGGGDSWLTQVSVGERWRRTGVALAMMTRVLERLRDAGFARVLSSADGAVAAGISLCLKAGYEPVASYTRVARTIARGAA